MAAMMNLLLDTHVAIWAVSDTRRLPARIKEILSDPSNELHVSAASIWEISVKYRLGKPSAPPFSGHQAIELFEASRLVMLDIKPAHAAAAGEVAIDHADPFDRLLLAQALTEPMRLVTHDRKLIDYGDMVIGW